MNREIDSALAENRVSEESGVFRIKDDAMNVELTMHTIFPIAEESKFGDAFVENETYGITYEFDTWLAAHEAYLKSWGGIDDYRHVEPAALRKLGERFRGYMLDVTAKIGTQMLESKSRAAYNTDELFNYDFSECYLRSVSYVRAIENGIPNLQVRISYAGQERKLSE